MRKLFYFYKSIDYIKALGRLVKYAGWPDAVNHGVKL